MRGRGAIRIHCAHPASLDRGTAIGKTGEEAVEYGQITGPPPSSGPEWGSFVMLLQSTEPETLVAGYLADVRKCLADVPAEELERLLARGSAYLELEMELQSSSDESGRVTGALARLGEPERFAQRLRSLAAPPGTEAAAGGLNACRACKREVSVEAMTCPHCGAPFPARAQWKGHGYEWKSKQTMLGLPLVHVAAGRDERGKLRVAKGIVAIGQFAVGGITIAQFGVGAVFALGQFVAAPIAIGQIAVGLVAVGQFGIGLLYGLGMFSTGLWAKGAWTFGNRFRGR